MDDDDDDDDAGSQLLEAYLPDHNVHKEKRRKKIVKRGEMQMQI